MGYLNGCWNRVFLALIVGLLAGPLFCHAEEPAAGKQVEQQLQIGGRDVGYLLYLPDGYEAGQSVPLMLFLHGRGESNGPLSLVKKWGPPRNVEHGDPLPYIVVSPQCPREDSWSSDTQQELLLKLLDHILANFSVDADRVYLTGLSMGGFGSWRLAADHPERFAAVAPICGRGNPQRADKLKNLPIWAWHGDKDGAVPFSASVDMVEAIRQAGGTKVRFTSLEEIGHNSWSAAYSSPELYDWFNKQTISGNRQ